MMLVKMDIIQPILGFAAPTTSTPIVMDLHGSSRMALCSCRFGRTANASST
jgi:hypothetical protein